MEGDFKWLGEGGLFIQGEIRKGLESRIVRSDMKQMEELVEKEARRQNKTLVDPAKKAALDAFFQVSSLIYTPVSLKKNFSQLFVGVYSYAVMVSVF